MCLIIGWPPVNHLPAKSRCFECVDSQFMFESCPLLNKLGGTTVVINDHVSIGNAIAKAKRYVDELN